MKVDKIEKDKWYIVDLVKKSRRGTYQIFRKVFDTKKQAESAKKRTFGDAAYEYEVIKGAEALEFGFEIRKSKLHYRGDILKYDYPPSRTTKQARKSFRTKYRRWKRKFKKELTAAWSAM